MKKTTILIASVMAIAAVSSASAGTLGSYTFTDVSTTVVTITETTPTTLDLTLGAVSLNGTSSATPYKTVSGDSLVFDSNIGNTAGAYATQIFTLTNNGTDELTIKSLTLGITGWRSGGQVQNTNDAVSLNNWQDVVGGKEGSNNKPITVSILGNDDSELTTSKTYNLLADEGQNVWTFNLKDAVTLGTTEGSNTFTFTVKVANPGDYTKGAFVGIQSLAVSDTAAVPEPATATLSLLALAGLAARRRRK